MSSFIHFQLTKCHVDTCFLSSVASDDKDGHELKLEKMGGCNMVWNVPTLYEKLGQLFQVLMLLLCLQKSSKTLLRLVLSDGI